MLTDSSDFDGKRKAAILLVSLGPEASSEIFKHLRDEEIEQLTLEIARLNVVEPEVRDNVFNEFQELVVAQQFISQGGLEYARDLLERSLGTQKAVDVINRLTSSLQVKPFDFIRRADPIQLLNFIQGEHPQTIAMILAYIGPEKASAILSGLSPEIQSDVAKRIATMDRTSPEIIREVERVLERKLSSMLSEDFTSAGGVDSIVKILNIVDRGTEKTIMEELEKDDPELAEEIRRKMFVFEDIIILDEKAVQLVLREVEQADLSLALKATPQDVKDKIYKNMSKRAAAMLQEDMEFMGPVRMRDVEESQMKVVSVIRRLEDAGEIIIARGRDDELVV